MHLNETNVVRGIALTLLMATLVPLGGCRICADCQDMAYPAYGGSWQRTDRYSGRLGSLFDPGGAKGAPLNERDSPPSPDELERQRQQERGGKLSDPYSEDEDADDATMDPEDFNFEERERELEQKQLDDIEGEREEELERKGLDDINVRIVPGQPMPPIIQ